LKEPLLKHERLAEIELFTRWFSSLFSGKDEALIEGIDTLQEVKTMLATAWKRKEKEWLHKG